MPGHHAQCTAKGVQVSAVARSIFAERRRVPETRARAWVVGERSTATNERLVHALSERVDARFVQSAELNDYGRRGDAVLGRLDVRRTLDGVEDGLWALRRAERRGMRVLNPAPSLMTCHDKLQTAIKLGTFGVPQPATAHVGVETSDSPLDFPVVVKPRFGSWGGDVFLCASGSEYQETLTLLHERSWFQRQGALVQALVPPLGFDLRVVVAAGRIVGAIERVAARGEWRTSVALGGSRRAIPYVPPVAGALALTAAAAVEADLVGVDLLPLPQSGYVVLEVNGAVDFTPAYSLGGVDVFTAIADSLASHALSLTNEVAEAESGHS
jgi:[lysine-biosynthesis-protein LysW]---L-2-aminoadipate ligase